MIDVDIDQETIKLIVIAKNDYFLYDSALFKGKYVAIVNIQFRFLVQQNTHQTWQVYY